MKIFKYAFIAAIIAIIVFCNISNADDSVTTTVTRKKTEPVTIYSIRWVADGSGNIADDATGNPISITRGFLVGVYFMPDSGATAPDDEYNLYLYNATGSTCDWLIGTGAGLEQSEADSTNIRSPLTSDGAYPFLFSTTYYLNGDSIGADNAGYLFLAVKEPK